MTRDERAAQAYAAAFPADELWCALEERERDLWRRAVDVVSDTLEDCHSQELSEMHDEGVEAADDARDAERSRVLRRIEAIRTDGSGAGEEREAGFEAACDAIADAVRDA